jgi:hypothetical protein
MAGKGVNVNENIYPRANEALVGIQRFNLGGRWLSLYHHTGRLKSCPYSLYWDNPGDEVLWPIHQHAMTDHEVFHALTTAVSRFSAPAPYGTGLPTPAQVAEHEARASEPSPAAPGAWWQVARLDAGGSGYHLGHHGVKLRCFGGVVMKVDPIDGSMGELRPENYKELRIRPCWPDGTPMPATAVVTDEIGLVIDSDGSDTTITVVDGARWAQIASVEARDGTDYAEVIRWLVLPYDASVTRPTGAPVPFHGNIRHSVSAQRGVLEIPDIQLGDVVLRGILTL